MKIASRFSLRILVPAIFVAFMAMALLVAAGFAQGFPFSKPGKSDAIPQLFSYQGILTDVSTGAPLNGSYQMVFKLYTVPSGGSSLWEEPQDVTVENGLFNVYLGSVTPLDPDDFVIQEMYLGVTVGTDQEMEPRLQLASAPFAITAGQSYCALSSWFQDLDSDLYGNASVSVDACSAPTGFVANDLDCNDTLPGINPGAAEVCNSVDDNCNISVDEGNPGGGLSCSTFLPGVCAAGTTQCSAGSIACIQNVQPSAEVCDGLDNNCNGSTDEGNPGGGLSCVTGQLGVCSAGTSQCSYGAIACIQNVQPSAEVCDGLDNDCNGVIDDNTCSP